MEDWGSLHVVSFDTICRMTGDDSLRGNKAAVALAQIIESAKGNLSNLKTLSLGGSGIQLGNEGVVALAQSFQSGHVSNLTSLDLSSCALGDEAVVALAQSFQWGHVSNLTTLNLSECQLGDEGVVALAQSFQSGHASNLTTLNLSRCEELRDKGVVALAQSFQSGHVSNLTTLNLSSCFKLRDEGVVALAQSFQSGHVSNLTTLNLSYCQLRDEGVVTLAQSFQSGHVRNLTTLNLSSGFILGDEGLVALAQSFQSGHVSNLTTLGFSRCNLHHKGLVALAQAFQSGHTSNLTTLNLSHCELGDEGVVALAQSFQSGHVSNLTTLNLSHCKLGDEGVVALTQSFQSGYVSNLTTLNLSHCYLGDKRAVALAQSFQSGHMSNLMTLNLSHCYLGDEGMVSLAQSFQSGHVSNLITLNLSHCELGDEGVVALAQSFQSGHVNNLNTLDLDYNYSLGEKGIIEIARMLETGHLFLQELRIQPTAGGEVSQVAKLAVLRAYKRNTSLVVVIPFLQETDEGIRRLQERNKRWAGSLSALQNEPDVPGTHGKVFLCGNPLVGKTTLRATLMRGRWKAKFTHERRPRQVERTRGIEVSQIVSKDFSDGHPLVLAIWDLAGQSEYHVLHSAFLPDLAFADGQATFFVIVCRINNLTNGSIRLAKNELLYWLRFISSSSVKCGNNLDLRRQVLVVLNCSECNHQCGHHLQLKEWKDFLLEQSEKFAAFLAIHPDPFILDARVTKQVKSLKSELKYRAKEMLQRRQMPQICRHVQVASKQWAQDPENKEYPVLAWQQYSSRLFEKSISKEKLEAATVYLHEVGHLIFFKEGALVEGGLPSETLVILDPEWFCRKVVGHLLLPESMVVGSETPLRKMLAADGSLPSRTLQNTLEIPANKYEEVVAILLRLGLCYRPYLETDKRIFVPTLIEHNPPWPSTINANEQAWVMGFSLVLKDSSITLLPMTVFRKLQVELAQDRAIGRRADCEFATGNSRITFKSKGMNVLVEFSADSQLLQGHQDSTTTNRVDILVKPLVHDDDFVILRAQLVHMANDIADRVLRINGDCCPEVELVRKIVKPWSSTDLLPPMMNRDVTTSVEDVITRGKENGLQTMNWYVGNVLVKEEELLWEGDLQELQLFMENKCDRIMEVVDRFGLMEPPEVSNNSIADTEVEYTDVQPETLKLMQHIDRRTEHVYTEVVQQLGNKIDELFIVVKDLRDSLHQLPKQQKALIRSIQSLERLYLSDKESSVPRFAYLAEAGKPSAWMKMKRALTDKFTLHFLCEAPHGDHTFHEVDGQAGIDIRWLKDWAKKLAPVLDWALTIAFVTAKIAGTAVLPGLGLLIPDLPPGLINSQAQTTNAIADLLQLCSSAALSAEQRHHFVSDSQVDSLRQSSSSMARLTSLDRRNERELRGAASQVDSLRQSSSSMARLTSLDRRNERELRGAARAVVKEVLDKLNSQEFEQQVGLRRVWLSDSGSHDQPVVWICQKCCDQYGKRAVEI